MGAGGGKGGRGEGEGAEARMRNEHVSGSLLSSFILRCISVWDALSYIAPVAKAGQRCRPKRSQSVICSV